MECPSSFLLCLLIFALSALFLLLRRTKSSQWDKLLPPGPPGWPVFGNMFDLGTMPHRTLAGLRDKYGHVIWLRLGAINTMVILSTKAATEFFKNHDLSFADRAITETMSSHDYYKSSLVLAPYGSYWRVLRRLVKVDMLATKRINESAAIRRKCVDNMVLCIEEEVRKKQGEAPARRGIHVAWFVFLMQFNLLGNLMLSRDMWDPHSKDASELMSAMMVLMERSGHPNLADFFPWLRWLDPQGSKRKTDRILGKALEIASKLVREREREKKAGKEEKKDFLDVLLEFEGNGKDEPAKFSEKEINIFILEIFMAGTETTSSTIEWAMTELLCNPETLTKAKAELSEVVGPNRKVDENDIENLPYLQAVIKETLRLHPPLPLLIPRRATEDTNFMGYHIPENTQVFVNAWAIGRDPDMWDNDPSSFKPERFVGSKIDYKGQDYQFIPFGAGRRMCVGMQLAHRALHLALASLLHQFDWKLDVSVTKETMDMRDMSGVTTRKLEPLIAVPIKSIH